MLISGGVALLARHAAVRRENTQSTAVCVYPASLIAIVRLIISMITIAMMVMIRVMMIVCDYCYYYYFIRVSIAVYRED